MDKNAIKKYAVWAREELIEKVTQKLMEYGIEESAENNHDLDSYNGVVFSEEEMAYRKQILSEISKIGFAAFVEKAAYTWFNRFTALRYMEVNGYLHVRVFSDENNNFRPQILSEAMHLDIECIDMDKVLLLKEENKNEELFKYLLVQLCNSLENDLPGMFRIIDEYMGILLPDYLLRDGSVIEQMISSITEEDWKDQVQIIGWLYQYYNDAVKESVISLNKTIEKKEIPAATQLFTTDWVVRYLVDNTVGKFWIEHNPNSQLREKLSFYVGDNGNSKSVEPIKPQDVTVFDPCMGSGHFLVYAFDVLIDIYREYGYSDREAAEEIVKNNIYGFDIDDRAAQLSYFALMMKARSYDRRFFSKKISPNLVSAIDTDEFVLDIKELENILDNETASKLYCLAENYKNGKEIGSIVNLYDVDIDVDVLFEKWVDAKETAMNNLASYAVYTSLDELVLGIIKETSILTKKYAAVVTNPPYMNKFSSSLKKYATDNYKDYSGDLYSIFMYKNFEYCIASGYAGFMTPFTWMFIRTYEKLRKYILNNKGIVTLIQMEYSAFEEATVPICSFVIKNAKENVEGLYFKLSDFKGGMEIQKEKVLDALSDDSCNYVYRNVHENMKRIPGTPISFWLGKQEVSPYDNSLNIEDYIMPMIGMVTGDTNRFLRFWHEVDFNNIGFGYKSEQQSIESGKRWFPYQKGGGYRRWYGNNEYVVNWENGGYEIKFDNYMGKRVRSHNYNGDQAFVGALTWSSITSSKFSARYVEDGFLYDVAGPFCKVDLKYRKCMLAFISSKVADLYLNAINPTINFVPGTLLALPLVPEVISEEWLTRIDDLASKCIELEKDDWNSYENSWEFVKHPLVRGDLTTIEAAFEEWKKENKNRHDDLKKYEEELNSIFVRLYGLESIVDPCVSEKDVTITAVDRNRDIKSLISYAVGCMFGRYSLDAEGLQYAGGTWNADKYISFIPDEDAIIPICDDEYFADDILGRFVAFIEAAYGHNTIEENLQFIATALGGSGTPREVIRNYFINEFYSDHVKMYQKRPIYWLFDSGKKNGFKCLVYMHRYQSDTVARIRTDYVHEQQARYRTAIEEMINRIENASGSDKVRYTKRLNMLKAQDEEIHVYEEKIHHLADQMIEVDLNDGVKKNYEIFKDVLAKIK